MTDRITKSYVESRVERINNMCNEEIILHHGNGVFQIRKKVENGGEADLSKYGNLRSVNNFLRAVEQMNYGEITMVDDDD